MKPRLHRLLVLIALVFLAGALLVYFQEPIRQTYARWATADVRMTKVHGSGTVRSIPQNTPYDRWLAQARALIPVFEGVVLQDVSGVPLKPWPELGEGVRGLYLRFADYQITDGRIIELPMRGSSKPTRHLYEMALYFLSGPGHTLFFRDDREPLRVDWQAGGLLSVPMNVRYQHFSDSDQPVRFLAVTSFPFVLNASASESFVNENDFDFTDRFDGNDDYFRSQLPIGDKRFAANYVPDVRATALAQYDERGAGSTTIRWAMAGNTQIDMHASEIPAQMYKKAHRHSSDAFILILSGEGYSLTWPGDEVDRRMRVDWKEGTLFVPPTYWYHQHLNVGREPARYLAINVPLLVRNLGLRFADQLETDTPGIRAEWEREMQARK